MEPTTHKSLTLVRLLYLLTPMRYAYRQDNPTLSDEEQLKVSAILRRYGLGGHSFHPGGRVVVHSLEPAYARIKSAFPNCQIEDDGPLELDVSLYRFKLTFIPDRNKVYDAAPVLSIAAHG